MVQFLSRYYRTTSASGGLSWTGKKGQRFTVTRLKMKQRCIKDMSVGESSPIPLKPTLARTVSAKRRHQWLARPRTPQKTTSVLSSLWSSGKSRQGVWSRAAELTDDSDVEEVEELMPYDQSQSEQSSSSTGESSSDRLQSFSSLEDYCSSSDMKQSV
ncbi:uncharacterized protein LOC111088070 [Limulus polyphemus]|uniref:Uncharacterized protein LOC111088070 n=1 Tax=Limulus polyphemus TaxID=6850 RepID=A0ABM1T9U6_LIMPO|nr:uncharacterized protein LOC111088070 [Limulus polyphemus]XP_022252652.1 uncharacterized protein LOC111088070 [Limulus polyphemus]XP_022252654.1 uncharacterized protein LOC111088070 [Limulus polyphemus]